MDRFLRLFTSFFHCRTPRTTFILLWICGLLTGSLVSISADEILAPTMLAAISGSLSISGLLLVLFFPLLLTAAAVFISRPAVLYLIAFLKAFLFAFTGIGLLLSLESSGWLVRCLLMFSDSLLLPFLWLLWLQMLSGHEGFPMTRFVSVSLLALLTGILDCSFVAPFLAGLLSF